MLIHRGEHHKPSSTGRLVGRVVKGAACHLYQRATRFSAATGFSAHALEPTRELWILHPSGDTPPAHTAAQSAPTAPRPHVLLLDGTWRQAGEMLRSLEGMVEGLRLCVRLPDAGGAPSRFWLRDQPGPMQLSTAEALMGVFRGVGEHEADRRLRLHFEMHVYATLLARGRREMAERYLGDSPLLAAAADAVNRLHARRSRSIHPDGQSRTTS